MIIALINCGTSLFAGIVVYSVLGFREVRQEHCAEKLRKPISLKDSSVRIN